jgi:hypothetical protein
LICGLAGPLVRLSISHEMRKHEVAMLTTVVMILMAWLVAGVLVAWVLGRTADLGSRDDVRLQQPSADQDRHDDALAPIKY